MDINTELDMAVSGAKVQWVLGGVGSVMVGLFDVGRNMCHSHCATRPLHVQPSPSTRAQVHRPSCLHLLPWKTAHLHRG